MGCRALQCRCLHSAWPQHHHACACHALRHWKAWQTTLAVDSVARLVSSSQRRACQHFCRHATRRNVANSSYAAPFCRCHVMYRDVSEALMVFLCSRLYLPSCETSQAHCQQLHQPALLAWCSTRLRITANQGYCAHHRRRRLLRYNRHTDSQGQSSKPAAKRSELG